MNLTRLAVRNALFVVIVLLVAILLGVRSYIAMPRAEDPQVDFPIFIITAIYPGTSPEDMESLVVDPLEEAINQVESVTSIDSKLREGAVVISVEAEYGEDSQKQYDDLLREISSVREDLPAGVIYFDVQQIKPEDRVNFKLLALTSDVVPYGEMHDVAEDIKDELEDVDGVNSVSIDASPADQITVSVDYERMASLNVNLRQVVTVLQSNNVNVPGGDISSGIKNFTIESSGSIDNLADIEKAIVTATPDQIIRIRDVATVKKGHEDLLWKAQYNQQKCIYIASKVSRGYNILTVDQEVNKIIQRYQSELPPNLKLNVAFEQAPAVEARINDFLMNLIQGILLVGAIILLVLGWRAAIIIVTIIPICVIIALAILSASGFGLQQISIASLVLALGLLVDNGIVVIENITRFIKEGLPKKEAAIKGASEVSLAIASSTVTTLLSFFPLTQLGEGPGLFLKSLPLTVIYTLVISLIIALTFSPIMSNWVLSNKVGRKGLADRFFDWFTDRIYQPTLRVALRFGWLAVLFAIALTAFSVSLFPRIGVSFFPTADKPVLLVDIDTPLGSSLEETERGVDYVESLIDTVDIVIDYTSNVGNSNPQIYYNRIPRQFQKNHGQVLVNLKEWEQQSFYTTIAHLRRHFADYAGAKITVEELKNGAPVPAPIEIRLYSEDLNRLKQYAQEVEDRLSATPDVINIVNPMRRNQVKLKVELDKEKAGLLGIDELSFDQTVRASLNGLQIDQITLEDQDDYALVVRMPFDESPQIDDLSKLYIANAYGGQVPLSHVAKISFQGGPAAFNHMDLDRYVAVNASVVNLDETIPKTLEVMEKLKAMDWPDDIKYEFGGEYEEQQSTFGSLGIILILAQIAIFAVLVLQFRSILQPIIVFAAIPLAISGSFLALYLTGWRFSFFAFVGLISLIGIVVNNSIIMVDYINQLIEEGTAKMDAIIQGSIRRFKPIILTTMTTILGLVPLTMAGTNQWSPLCWTIIGGMISSTLLTLIIVPILYKWLTLTNNPMKK